MRDTHDLGPFVVLAVLLQNETVGREGCHGVEEGEDGDGDKELGGGRVVPHQEEALAVPPFTGGSIEVDLMEPGSAEGVTQREADRIHGVLQVLGSKPGMDASLPERVFKLHFDSQVAIGSVFTLHAHLEHAGVTSACREGKDGKDLQVRRRPW